jgi:RNA polymerase sigma factor (sigma-70 family)
MNMGRRTCIPNNLSHEERAKLVESCRAYACHMAKRWLDNGVPFEDLQAAAYHGLVIASTYFDPSRGFRFTTYATRWVFQTIQRLVEQETSKGFRGLPPQFRNGKRSRYHLAPFREERFQAPEGDLLDPTDLIAEDEQPQPFDKDDMAYVWFKLMSHLTPRERSVLTLRLRLKHSLQSVGDDLKLSKERVRQIENAALHKLKKLVARGKAPEVMEV